MTRAPRLALTLALTAVLGGAGARAADPDPLLPKETEQVYFINVKQILASDAGTAHIAPKIKDTLKAGPAGPVVEALGLDPLKDIDTVTVGGKADAQPANLVIVVRGKFSAEKLLKGAADLAEKHADTVAVVTENDLKMVRVGNAASKMYAHVADGETVIVGSSPKLVAASLDAKKTKAKAVLSKELTALLAKQDEKASVYFCQMTEGKLGDLNVPLNVPGIDADKLKAGMASVTSFALTVRAGKELDLTVTAGMKDEDAAKGFGDTMDKLLAAAKNFLPAAIAVAPPQSKTLLEDVAKTVKHEVKKGDVIVSAKLSAEAVGAMFASTTDKKK